jgi:hypothetical protein
MARYSHYFSICWVVIRLRPHRFSICWVVIVDLPSAKIVRTSASA